LEGACGSSCAKDKVIEGEPTYRLIEMQDYMHQLNFMPKDEAEEDTDASVKKVPMHNDTTYLALNMAYLS